MAKRAGENKLAKSMAMAKRAQTGEKEKMCQAAKDTN